MAPRSTGPIRRLVSFWPEAVIVGVCAAALIGGFSFARTRELAEPAMPETPLALRTAAPLAGLIVDQGAVNVSLDTASQAQTSITLAGAAAGVALPFRTDRPIVFVGWAVDHDEPAGGVYLVVDGTKVFAGLYGLERPDVAQALHIAALRSGFVVRVGPGELTAGRHELAIRVVDRTGKGYYEDNPRTTVDIVGAGRVR